MQSTLFLLVPLTPVAFGFLLLLPVFRAEKWRNVLVGLGLSSALALTAWLCLTGDGQRMIFTLSPGLPIIARSDALGRLFALLISGMWLITGIYSFGYLKHDAAPRRYFLFYLLTEGALLALCFSGTLVTLYLCFETMTLCSVALVLHHRTPEAVAGGIKYLLYSIAGAMMGLFGIFYLTANSASPVFTPGGVLDRAVVSGSGSPLLWIVLIAILGFSTKAGMFPMHGWLPTAHPVAPAPASAILSGVIVKSGVLCVIRILYQVVGVKALRGTWLQTVLLVLSLLTVFMGSMLALREDQLKKRLAYSTVSQVSYILFGLFLFEPAGFTGGLLHVWFHSFMKAALFLCAGAIMLQTGYTRVSDMRGLGKRMPLTFWCFTLTGIGLVGIPPLSGFISKWYLARGALAGAAAPFTWLGPVVLLLSALLTAGYIFPVIISGFFPGMSADALQAKFPQGEVRPVMLIPMLFLAALTVAFGLWPTMLQTVAEGIAASLM